MNILSILNSIFYVLFIVNPSRIWYILLIMIYLSLLQASCVVTAASKTDSCVAPATSKTDSDASSAIQDLIVDAEVKSPEKMKRVVARLMPYKSWGLKENLQLLPRINTNRAVSVS